MKQHPPKSPPAVEPAEAAPADPLAAFVPVPLAPRHNGWTADRQRLFLAALAETGCISRACEAASIAPRSAYRLRRDPRGAAFAAAWDQALRVATGNLATIAFERALRGGIRELWRDGELVAEIRQPSDSLLKFLLQHLAPDRFASRGPLGRTDMSARIALRDLPTLLDELVDTDVAADPLRPIHYDAIPPERLEGKPRPPAANPADEDDAEDAYDDSDDGDYAEAHLDPDW
ncbi:hypothetical protein [Sphingomonas sp.]|uniref:hypothetical protein n=1 Tax=Sphingomonas sp. TaxID=28214 RepID=UPI001AFD8E77|nr:hypothetical protein [Sphingomonas sp.]MBO9712323.1 hypothetical protein [Sphingomonas sp.]